MALLFAAIFTAWAALQFLFRGEAVFAKYKMSFGAVIAFYLGGAVAAGAVVGMLLPLGRSTGGAALLGFIAGIPVAVAFRIALSGFAAWTVRDTIFLILWPLVLGAPAGTVLREVFAGERSG